MTAASPAGFRRLWLPAYVAAVLAFMATPILVVLVAAFTAGTNLTFPPRGLSLRWFRAVASDPGIGDAFAISVEVALAATLVSMIAGIMAAIALDRGRLPMRAPLEMLFIAPLTVPSIILATSLIMLFSPVGLVQTLPGLVLAHVAVTLPYVIRVVGGTLQGIPRDYEEIAGVLGAGAWQRLRFVLLPMMAPGLVGAAIFSLITSFDEFTISLFLSGPGLKTLPVEIYDHAESVIDPLIAAVGTVMVVITTMLVLAVEKTLGLKRAFRL